MQYLKSLRTGTLVECEDGRMKQWLRQDTEDFCI
ncbi:hypothetical protein F383_06275 [Gossypium arboreum]|uniref:AXH domain-containing protein n=1 Tax=Gossypium arboreum TaxID=29729 RepID=A0A0B0NXD6_GOSAR|nr:hypothetical protein F383_06275 [Gossypium arboreum]